MVSIMKHYALAGMLGLAVAGCAQSRSAMPGSKPVGMEPVPSIHDTINRGTGDAAVQKSTLADPEDPRWSGRITARRSGPSSPPARAVGPAGPQDAQHGVPQPLPAIGGVNAGQAAVNSPATAPEADGLDPQGQDSPPPTGPEAFDPAAGALPPMAPPENPDVRAEGLPSVEEPKALGVTSTAPAVSPEAPAMAAVPSDPPATPSSPRSHAPAGDPLLGPDPQLMPAMDFPAPADAGAKPAPSRSSASARPATRPGSAGDELPLEAPPPPLADPHPARAEPAKPPTAPNPAGTGSNNPGTAALAPAPRTDSAVRLASTNSATMKEVDRNWKEAGRAAARVGDEVITLHDLVLNVKEQLKKNPPGRDLSKRELNMVAKSVLAGLIERTLIAQEAKRELKNPKQLDRLYEAADKYWREEEIPPMMRRYMVDNVNQLRQKLTESGRSLESLHQSYRQEFLAQVFIQQKLSARQKVELPEMLEFYSDHMNDKSFHRGATVTWRELVVEKGRHPNPAEASKKAESLLARLRRGEDFASLARTESEGPTRVRAEGGLMQTSPGSYAVESVNAALATLPLNTISPILEGPTSLHIVRVEGRREAGPATFEEIQDQIRRRILTEKMVKARGTFLAKLRRETPIDTIFDGTESDPNAPEPQ